jgi:cation transport ATPase
LAAKKYSLEEARELWRQEPDDNVIFKAVTENIEEYPPEIQAVIKEEAERRRRLNETVEEGYRKSGKQRARTIALILMLLVIIAKITDTAKGNHTSYVGMIDMAFEALIAYCLVMYVGYPIVRRTAGKRNKPKDKQEDK